MSQSYIKETTSDKCPECGNEGIYEIYGHPPITVITGADYDSIPEYETIEFFDGFRFDCQFCDFLDGEPPMPSNY